MCRGESKEPKGNPASCTCFTNKRINVHMQEDPVKMQMQIQIQPVWVGPKSLHF